MDIKMDATTNDIIVTGGLQLATDIDEKRQRIDLAINLNLGEFFAAVNYGLPWIKNTEEDLPELRYFLGEKSPDQARFVANQLDRYLAKIPFVVDVNSDFSFDQATRQFTYNFTVLTDDGDEINFPAYTDTL